jgi:hypothetical protein
MAAENSKSIYHDLTAIRGHHLETLAHAQSGLHTILQKLIASSSSEPGDRERLPDNEIGGLLSAALMCAYEITDFTEGHEREGPYGAKVSRAAT